MTETVRSFIDAKGGNAAVARDTGYQPGAVALWVHRNRLPRTAWPEIMKAYDDADLDRLLALEAACATPKATAANDDIRSSEAA